MQTSGKTAFVGANVIWQCVAAIFLSLLGVFSLDLYLVLSLLGFLALVEVTAATAVQPYWRARLRWVGSLGLLLTTGAVARRFLVTV